MEVKEHVNNSKMKIQNLSECLCLILNVFLDFLGEKEIPSDMCLWLRVTSLCSKISVM